MVPTESDSEHFSSSKTILLKTSTSSTQRSETEQLYTFLYPSRKTLEVDEFWIGASTLTSMAKLSQLGHIYSEMGEKEHKVIKTHITKISGSLLLLYTYRKHDLWLTKTCILDQMSYSFFHSLSFCLPTIENNKRSLARDQKPGLLLSQSKHLNHKVTVSNSFLLFPYSPFNFDISCVRAQPQ